MVVEERQQQFEMEQQRMRLRSLGLDAQSPRPSAAAAAPAPVALAPASSRPIPAANFHASISTNLDLSQAPPPSTVGTEYSAQYDRDPEASARDSDEEAYSDTFVSESVGSEVLDALEHAAATGTVASAAAPVSLVPADEAAVLSSIRLLLKRIDKFSLSASVEARADAASY